MEATSSGEHTPNNNDFTNQQQRSTQDMTNSSSSSYIIERRQMLTDNERERIHSMTQQRRQSYLARRRSNYQIRRMEFTSPISTSNQHDQQINWRLTQRTRQRSINEDARNMELARRRTNYRRRQDNERSAIPNDSNLGSNDFVAPNTMIQESTHNIGENLVDVTTVRQTYRSEPISFHTLTSNYERGSSSTRLPRPNSVHQDLGCGNEWISIAIAEKWSPLKVYGLDINPRAVQISWINLYLNSLDENVQPIYDGEKKTLLDRVEFHETDLLSYYRDNHLELNQIVGCIPQGSLEFYICEQI